MIPELKVKDRDIANLSIVLIMAIALALLNISVRLIDRIQQFFETFSNSPTAEFLINFGFLYLVGLLWLTYRRWRDASKKKEEFQRIIETISPDVLLLVDTERNVLMCNSTVERMLGYSESEVINHKMDMLYSDEQTDSQIINVIFEAPTGKGFYSNLAVGKKKNGETLPLEVISGRLSSGRGAVLLLRDITDRIEAKEQRDKAEAANRAKSTFLASVSHEIRTPMNAIIGMAELVLGTELTVQQKEYLWTLKTSADSLLSLLNLILDLSKIEAGQLELDQIDFDLHSILVSATEMLSVRAKEAGLELVFHIEPGVPVALIGDPLRLRQIVINLTDNAIKFTQEGQVAVSVETQKEEGSHVLLHFAVSDTGVGIRADQTETIFESFKQAGVSVTRRHPGTGLGLAICKQLVEMMGGKIWVDSELGKGSTFHFTTRFQVNPVEKSEPLDATVMASGDITDERVPHAIPEAPRRLNILVVEDNPVNQKVAAAMLEQLGHDVVLASSGRLAVQVLDKHEIDLILMDIQMPEMDGFEVTKLIRQREITNGGHIPIVAVTAHAMQGDRERCLAAGMDDYISKPIRSRSLSSVIQNLTNGSRGKKKESDPLLSDAGPVTQEIFDLSKAMSVVGGDKVLFEEVANVFLEDASEKVAKIREGVVRADASTVEKAAMTLKDSVVYFGAQRAFDAASRLELMGKNGTWTEVEAAQLELEKEIKTLEVAMRRAMAA